MSRTLRSALSIAQRQSLAAGPSSRPALRISPVPASAPMVATRSMSWLSNIPMPASWRRSMKKDDEGHVPDAKPNTSAKDAAATPETGSLFDTVEEEAAGLPQAQKKWHEHRYKSGYHKMSHRKLNDISRQVTKMPVDEAMVQLQFSEKRAARTWIKSTLALARDHAEAKGLRRDRMIVAQTWVSKGPKIARIDIKGRGRHGIKHHPSARIHFLLKEGKTLAEQQAADHKKALRKVRSAGVVREDGKLRRKMTSGWAW